MKSELVESGCSSDACFREEPQKRAAPAQSDTFLLVLNPPNPRVLEAQDGSVWWSVRGGLRTEEDGPVRGGRPCPRRTALSEEDGPVRGGTALSEEDGPV